ncbi:MAG: purine-cytosine permease family protein [Propionibacteriaceae bacterium]
MSQRQDHAVGVIERRGIEPVPDSERNSRLVELFWMWFGANMGVLGITMGAALVSIQGLSTLQALTAAVLGSALSFLVVAAISIAGKRGAAPGLTLSRAIFGIRGNWGPTLISWLGFVGWETVMCTTAAFALCGLAPLCGLEISTPMLAAALILTVVIAAVIGIFGHATLLWLQKWLTWIFGLLTLVVVAVAATRLDREKVFVGNGVGISEWIATLGFVMAGTGLGWVAAGPDYTRYLPRHTSAKKIVTVTTAGALIPLTILLGLGVFLAVNNPTLAQSHDPVASIGAILPGWILAPYLLTVAVGLITAADLSMYSSGLNLLAGGIAIPRMMAVGIDAVLIIISGLWITVVAQDFFGPFTTFLTLLAVPLSGWAGIFGMDLALGREYDAQSLLDTSKKSGYYYRYGINIGPCILWLVALILGFCCSTVHSGTQIWFQGPLSNGWIGSHGLGWLVSGGIAALGYLFLVVVSRYRHKLITC